MGLQHKFFFMQTAFSLSYDGVVQYALRVCHNLQALSP